MKALRFLRALPLALILLSAPLRAEQGTIVGPVVGPKTMADVMGILNAAMLAIQTCNSGSSAPTNGPAAAAVHYQCWADTTTNPVLYKTFDGASWVTFGALNTTTHVWTPYRNGAPIAAVATSSSAADLTTGILPAARLPVPSASTLGGVQSKTCSASQWLNDVSTSGVPSCAQPNFTDLAGTASLAQLPAFSGMTAAAAAADTDTIPTNQGAGNLKQTLAAIKTWIKAWIVKADVGLGNVDNTSDATKWAATKTFTNTTFNCGSTGNVCTVRLGSDITGFGTGVATALGVNIGSAGASVLFNGALGTPSSGVATNLTGTAAGLTAGNVTTNANMTGDVTSVGNSTTLTNAPVIAKVLTGFTSGAGTVTAADSILSAIQKVYGNDALKLPLAGGTMSGNIAMGGNAITGAGAITGTAITGTSYSGLPTATPSVLGVVKPDGTTITVSGGTLTAIGAAAASIDAAGATSISNGTATYILYNNAGKVGNIQSVPVANGGTGDTGLGWTSYTPVLTANAGSPTTSCTGAYLKIGKTVNFRISCTYVSGSVSGANGWMVTSPPFNANGNQPFAGREVAVTTGDQQVAHILTGTQQINFRKYDGSFGSTVGSTFVLAGIYECT